MTSNVSALVDGELGEFDTVDTLNQLRRHPALRNDWCTYHRIGAAMRGENVEQDSVAKVMAALALEPTVLAPKVVRLNRLEQLRPALAVAASLAGVSVVAWLAFPLGNVAADRVSSVARSPVINQSVKRVAVAKAQKPVAPQERLERSPQLQDYVLAHQMLAPSGVIVGGNRSLQTVSVERVAR